MTDLVARAAVLTAYLLAFTALSSALPAPGASAAESLHSPRLDAWRVLGPGGGGTMLHPTISPHDSNVVFEICDMTGAYVTSDAGLSWRMFNLRSGVRAYAFDPADASTVYAANFGLWRSTDTGSTWSLVLPRPDKGTVERICGDHGEISFLTDDPAYPSHLISVAIESVVVDPRDSRVIYVVFDGGYWKQEPRSVLRSVDAGASWTLLKHLDPGDAVLAADADPDGGLLTLVTTGGVYAFDGARWQKRAAPILRPQAAPPVPSPLEHASCGRAADGRFLVYATVATEWEGGRLLGGVFVSDDRGANWRPSTAAIARLVEGGAASRPPRLTAIACSARDADTAYAGFEGLQLGEGWAGLYNGIARTTDAGRTWEIVKRESTAPSENAEISWVELRADENFRIRNRPDYNVWFDAPRSLGVAPGDGRVCYATDLFRTYRTLDGGLTWQTVNSRHAGTVEAPEGSAPLPPDSANRWTSRGLDVTTCYGVHFDPHASGRIYISYTDIGMFRSEDNGLSWIPSTRNIPLDWRNTTYWLEPDPDVPGLVWGVFSGTHDIPRPKMWRNRAVSGYRGGVATSTDGCASWTVTSDGMRNTAATHILLDPESPVGNRTLYVCGFGTGVWKSTDNGRSWSLRNNGIDYAVPFAWRTVRAGDGTLYLVVARKSERGGADPADDGALFRSVDGAESWTRMALPVGVNGPNGLAIDPKNDRRMYLAAWAMETPDGARGGGIFLSEDAGATWRNVLAEDQYVYDVTVDPRDPRILYACGFSSSAWRSTDRGQTWSRIRGYNFKWGHRVICDPADPSMIYITTFGGSVWHGPAAGDPDAVEDIVTGVPRVPQPSMK